MRILDTAKRRQKQQVQKDLRKAIEHTLDNVDVDEAWKALSESLQNAMDALGLGPGDDPHSATDGSFADMLMLVTMAIEVRKKRTHPLFHVDAPCEVDEEEFLAPGQICWVSEPKYVGKFVILDNPEKHAELNRGFLSDFSMGCSVKPPPCPFCDGDEECDC